MALTNLFVGSNLKMSVPREEDAEVMARWQEDSEYLRNVDTDLAVPLSLKQLEEEGMSVGSKEVYFRLRTLDADELIGFVAIHSIEWNNRCGMLAIGIGEACNRGKGYGTEAVRLMLRYAFQEMNLYRVGLDVIEYNDKGIRAYEKAGFKHEGRSRAAVHRDGERVDRINMGILLPEWEELYLKDRE
ncbi:GNAT family protein [Paenibacillus sp. JX-17]|uniref:GNAT family protein n=1 Tax=Paenibacillus lacisoli TaxID=3064525 RepID=A0ABT9CCZ7_9BACL|nr:GNAT family protein [Paenibacillus sp. JX-17]MDO7907145.1 GNAT family protein [Paenibacillus sp. JX-17]